MQLVGKYRVFKETAVINPDFSILNIGVGGLNKVQLHFMLYIYVCYDVNVILYCVGIFYDFQASVHITYCS